MIVLGVDVGGTFTDFVLADLEKQELTIHKTSSTPANPAIGVVNGLKAICEKAGIRTDDIDSLFHGTTVGTNAMLEHDGAVTGMITNAGFRDVLHIGRHQRPQHYSIMQDLPWQSRPLIRRRHRQTVAGRLNAAGQELIPLDEAALRSAARTLLELGVEAVLVGFLFSYVNPAHEQRAAQILREEMPDVFVTTSSDVAPQFREFERFTTGAISAFIGPKVRRYITQLQEELTAQGLKGELRVMTSSGGVATPEMIAQKPASTLLSGLVAGVRGGALIGFINGAITLYFRVNSLIVTLGVGTFLHGVTLWIGNSQTISGVSPMLMEWVIIQRMFGIPIAFYYAMTLAVLIWYMLGYTAFGQQLLFTGRGREVGRLTGVAVGRVRLTAFVLSGIMGAIAGVLYTGTTGSANPSSGTFLLLPAFAAAFLGATCIKPGRFNPWGAVIAVYFLVTGINGLSVLGFRTFVQDLFYGGALVLAVMVSQLVSGRKERSL